MHNKKKVWTSDVCSAHDLFYFGLKVTLVSKDISRKLKPVACLSVQPLNTETAAETKHIQPTGLTEEAEGKNRFIKRYYCTKQPETTEETIETIEVSVSKEAQLNPYR
ncbi:MAG: hypothetical protein WA631_19245 [Nitrososphaeraceae archaeon]